MKKHIGSTLAIVVGTLSIAAGINNMTNHTQDSNLFTGIVMVLGGLAYRSAKKRYLLETPNTNSRRLGETVSLAIALASVLLQNDLWLRMAYQPIPYIIAPAWALVAYAIISMKKQREFR